MSTPIKKITQNTTASKSPSIAGSSTSANGVQEKDLSKALEKLETKMRAINNNNIARVANSHLVSSTAPLHPLVSLKTGRSIDRFPETAKGLAKLSITLVDSTLLALEAERTGKEEEKRERLRVQIGLRADPA